MRHKGKCIMDVKENNDFISDFDFAANYKTLLAARLIQDMVIAVQFIKCLLINYYFTYLYLTVEMACSRLST